MPHANWFRFIVTAIIVLPLLVAIRMHVAAAQDRNPALQGDALFSTISFPPIDAHYDAKRLINF